MCNTIGCPLLDSPKLCAECEWQKNDLQAQLAAANAENKRLNEAFENLSKSTRNEIDCANEQYAILEQQLAHERKVVEVLADMVSKAYPKRYKRGCSESFSWAEWAHEQVRAEG